MGSTEYEFENRHLKNITELFLDISNQFQIKSIIRNTENLNIQINSNTLYNWTASKEFKNLANIADNNNLLCILDELNKKFVLSLNIKKSDGNAIFHTKASNYYNPYLGEINVDGQSGRNTNTLFGEFNMAEALDRTNTKTSKKNTALRKSIHSRRTVSGDSVLDIDNDIVERENIWAFTKRNRL
jgi:hypothetical protein